MSKIFFFALTVILISASNIWADRIVLTSGQSINGKVTSVTENEIIYTPEGGSDIQSMQRTLAEKIIYTDGSIAVIPKPSPEISNHDIPQPSVEDPQKNDADWSQKRFSFSIYPFYMIWFFPLLSDDDERIIILSAESEIRLSSYFSFACEYRYLGYKGEHFEGISPGLRLYPEGKGLGGWFLGLYDEGMFCYYKKDSGRFYFMNSKALILTAWVGRKWTWNTFYLELGTGVAYTKIFVKKDALDDLSRFMWTGVSFGVGVAF